jgi:class 3 adenylate cyclase
MAVQPNTLVTKILQLSREDSAVLRELEKFRRQITVMFTDIKGSTEFFEKYGDIAGLAMVHECNDLQRTVVEQHGGRVIKTIGDSVMAVFDNCEKSVSAAIEIQRKLRDKNGGRKPEDAMLVRIGLHHGIGIVKSDDVFGDVVNVASRVESVAEPLQIVISDSLRQQIIASPFNLVFLGQFRLKGKSSDRDLYRVVWDSADVAVPANVHSVTTHPGVTRATLQRLTAEGNVSGEYLLTSDGITVANRESEAPSADQPNSPFVRARFSLLDGQAMVEEVSGRGRVFIRLVGPYTLEQGDILLMGTRLFKFVCRPEVAAAATTLAKTVLNVSELLNQPAAEFRALTLDGSSRPEIYPLRAEEITLGRTKATYTFPDNTLMSRSHVRVYQRGEDFFLEDLNSRNGTFVMVRAKVPVPFGAPVLVGAQGFRVVQS